MKIEKNDLSVVEVFLIVFRKIALNIIAAFLLPTFIIMPDLLHPFFFPERYQPFEFQIGSFLEYISTRYWDLIIRGAVLTLAFILIPFQLIKNFYRGSENESISFLKKWIILTVIIAICYFFAGGFYFFLGSPWYLSLLFFIIPISAGFILTSFFHFLVDRYEDRVKGTKQRKEAL